MALKFETRQKIELAIDDRQPFKYGNMSGRWVQDEYDLTNGILPMEYWRALKKDLSTLPRYVVFSYDTPIGWAKGEQSKAEWVIPDVRYSVTTTHHQTVLRIAADEMPKSLAKRFAFLT